MFINIILIACHLTLLCLYMLKSIETRKHWSKIISKVTIWRWNLSCFLTLINTSSKVVRQKIPSPTKHFIINIGCWEWFVSGMKLQIINHLVWKYRKIVSDYPVIDEHLALSILNIKHYWVQNYSKVKSTSSKEVNETPCTSHKFGCPETYL